MDTRIVTFGEIMLRLATLEHQRFTQAKSFNVSSGGGEANVAVSVANYGLATKFVTRLPMNDFVESVFRQLKKNGVGTAHIIRRGERLEIYFLETGSVSRPSKVICTRTHSSIADAEPGMIDWNAVFNEASWFHWTGITHAISQGATLVCQEAIDSAKKKGIIVSCDLNFRKNLWKLGKSSSEVMRELVKACDIILGNEEDAEKVFGIASDKANFTKGEISGDNYESVCKKLKLQFPAAKRIIIILRGFVSANHNTWSVVLYDGEKLLDAPVYQITHIVDRVGSRDSFIGGLIHGIITYPGNDQKALNFAVAASCLKHTVQGDFNHITLSEVDQL